MDKNVRFYKCPICGNVIGLIEGNAENIKCCGKPMELMNANTSDGAVEKHVPVYEVKDNKVTVCVGSVAHPMTEQHYIEWIALQTKQGNQRKSLNPGEAPKACFRICDGDEVEAVYAYCNLHSLWKADK